MQELALPRSISLASFVSLNFLDAASTHVGIAQGLTESNFVPSQLYAAAGETGMYLYKMLVVWLVVAAVIWMNTRYRRVWYALHTANALVAIAVVSNLAGILGH